MFNWQLYYHVVWGTKNQLALIDPAWETDLFDFLWGRALTLDCIPRAIGGMTDHLHVVLSIPPKLAIASLVVQLKSSSCHLVNEAYADGSFLWQAEYKVLSFSETALGTMVEYVDNQKRHHASHTLIAAMESSIP